MTSDLVRTQAQPRHGLEPVCRRLESLGLKLPEDRALLAELIGAVEVVPSGRALVHEAPHVDRAGVIVSGWACRQRLLPDGRRQVFGFLLPGDTISLDDGPGPLSSTWTICVTKVGYAECEGLRRLLLERPDYRPTLTRALRRLMAQEEARLLDHIVRLGRHTAFERVGHMLLELHDRLRQVGMAEGSSFSMPLTQETLADALGLSVVHVNRVLQQLKREGLIELRAGRATLLQPELLAQICDYESPVC